MLQPLLRRDRAVFGDFGGVWAEICGGQVSDNADGFAGGVEERAAATSLFAGVYLAADELAVDADLDLDDLGQGGFCGESKPAVGAEITERIDDQTIFVHFHPAHHMRAVAEDEIGTRVDDRVGKGRKIAARLADKYLGLIENVLAIDALTAAVERDDDNIGFLFGISDELPGKAEIIDVRNDVVVGKANDGDTFALNLDKCGRKPPAVAAGVFDAEIVEHFARA